MTKEQEAIERLNKLKNRKILYGNRVGMIIEEFKTLQEDIETASNMLKEKDEIINEQLKENVELQKELNEENKRCMILANNNKFKEQVIDLMSEQLAGLTIWNNEKEEPVILGDKEEVKQYFERKVKNEH